MQPIEFEYWSDPLCIWAFVAQAKLEHVLEAYGDSVVPRYRVVPVFGSIRQRFREGAWAASGPEGRAEATARIAREHGHEDVSGRCWLDDCPASSWAPGMALKAVFALEHDGEVPPGTAETYQVAMRRRFFVESRNVARRAEQLALAESLSIPRAMLEGRLDDGSALCALFEDHERREVLGIRGSPTYVFDGGRAMLYGNFPESVLTATVDELVRLSTGVGGSAC